MLVDIKGNALYRRNHDLLLILLMDRFHYRKYTLTEEKIAFIEETVEDME